MTPIRKTLLSTAALCLLHAGSALAQDKKDKFEVDVGLNFQYIGLESPDLGTGNSDFESSFSEQLQLAAGANFTDDLFGYFYGRALNIDGDSGFDDDENGSSVSAEQSFLELRQLYLKKSNLFNVTPLSLQVGRQRVRETRAIWWNSDNDLVRLNYDSTLLSGFVAAGENMASYRTGEGTDFMEADEDRFRTLGEVSWQYRYNHFLEGRFLYEDDHSGLEPVGSVVDANDRDNEDQNIAWVGVRAAGDVLKPVDMMGRLKYRADVIGAWGEEDLLTTAAGAPGTRTVTGSRTRDVRAWAFDGGITADPGAEGGVVLTAGYAFGSGDDNPADGTDGEFRQSDMQGSSSRVGLERQQQKNYGEVLRPELSNLHVLTVGAGYPVTDATDVGLTYFHYRLDENATGLRSSGISAPMNNTDKDVGQALDFAVNVDVDDEFGLKNAYAKDIDFRFVVGSFFPGDAYGAGDHEAFRFFSELKFKF